MSKRRANPIERGAVKGTCTLAPDTPHPISSDLHLENPLVCLGYSRKHYANENNSSHLSIITKRAPTSTQPHHELRHPDASSEPLSSSSFPRPCRNSLPIFHSLHASPLEQSLPPTTTSQPPIHKAVLHIPFPPTTSVLATTYPRLPLPSPAFYSIPALSHPPSLQTLNTRRHHASSQRRHSSVQFPLPMNMNPRPYPGPALTH